MFWPRPQDDVDDEHDLHTICMRCAKFAAQTKQGVTFVLDRKQLHSDAYQAVQMKISSINNLAAITISGSAEAATTALAYLAPNATRDAKAEKAKKRPARPDDLSSAVLNAARTLGVPNGQRMFRDGAFRNLREVTKASIEQLIEVDGIGAGTANKIRRVCSQSPS